jgi:hypothetical protein
MKVTGESVENLGLAPPLTRKLLNVYGSAVSSGSDSGVNQLDRERKALRRSVPKRAIGQTGGRECEPSDDVFC